ISSARAASPLVERRTRYSERSASWSASRQASSGSTTRTVLERMSAGRPRRAGAAGPSLFYAGGTPVALTPLEAADTVPDGSPRADVHMIWLAILAGLGLLTALLALASARRISRRLDRLQQSYWDL